MSKKVHCRSLSSIHILYNQALVGGLSDSSDPATRIVNLSLDGGSIAKNRVENASGGTERRPTHALTIVGGTAVDTGTRRSTGDTLNMGSGAGTGEALP